MESILIPAVREYLISILPVGNKNAIISQENYAITLNFYTIDNDFKPVQIDFNPEGKVKEAKFKVWEALIQEIKGKFEKSVSVQAANIRKIIILFVKMKHLAEPSTYHNLSDTAINPIRPIIERKNWHNGDEAAIPDEFDRQLDYQPMITIGYEDIMELYTEKDGRIDNPAKNLRHLETLRLDSRFKFFDSSIWHRYVPAYPDPQRGTNFMSMLNHVLKQMCRCYEKGLYATNAARANLEFQLRMMRNSYIAKIGRNGHYEVVTPFKFHSETHFETKIKKHEDHLTRGIHSDSRLKWRLLLVDDYAERSISSFPEKACTLSKKDLIQEVIENQGYDIKIVTPFSKDTPVEHSGDNIIEACIEKMGKGYFDVLLLDYLLGKITPTQEEKKQVDSENQIHYKKREYGHDFLIRLREEHKENAATLKIGPLGKYWICPISSFPFALKDKLWQLGIHAYDDLWRLSDGGDPLCTPALFKYNLLSLMKRQVEESYYSKKELTKLFERFNPKKEGQKVDHRKWAKDLLRALKISQLRQDALKMDEAEGEAEGNGSYFAISMRKSIPIEYEDLTERMIDFLTAFAQWNIDTESWSKLDGLRQNFRNLNLHEYQEPMDAFWKQVDDFVDEGERGINTKIKELDKKGGIDLDFRRKRLEHIPKTIGDCQGLRSINLSNNKLQYLPEQIKNLKNLRKLDLSQNQFYIFPAVLETFKNKLNELDLSGNPLDLKISRATSFSEVAKMIEEGLKHTGITSEGNQIRKFVAEGKLKDALSKFSVWMPKISVFRNELILLTSRYHNLEKSNQGGTLSQEYNDVSRNQIISALLDFLREYEASGEWDKKEV